MIVRLRLAVTFPLALALGACAEAVERDVSESNSADHAYVGGTVVPSPNDKAIDDGVVLVKDGRIVAVGPRSAVSIPSGATRVDCSGATVLAGFWNSHVHFMSPEWLDAAHADADSLASSLRDMLTRWGFVHVVDTGSDLDNTLALERRIAAGEIAGPSIMTAGAPFVAVGGQPRNVPVALPELADAEQASTLVDVWLDGGAQLIKLMTASVVEDPPPPVMPLEVVRAATQAAHARGALVFAHPTNAEGIWAAVDGGVDVLAHTAPDMEPWSPDDVARLIAAQISLIPTLMLFRYEMERDGKAEELIAEVESSLTEQLGAFHAAGGTTLFGTDVGYTTVSDPSLEYALLERAGLDARAILAALTTAPAERFGVADRRGRLRAGADADLVVLDGDPLTDVSAWTRVRLVLRAGRTLYRD